MESKKFVVDTSIIIDGEITRMLELEKIRTGSEIIIPIAVLDELQSQASVNKEHGFVGLEEIRRIRDLCFKKEIILNFIGERPGLEDIRLARRGRIDAIIKDIALAENATLVTADRVQSLVAEAQGVDSMYISKPPKVSNLSFEDYFDENTMSVHIKEGVCPLAKKGIPGESKLIRLRQAATSRKEISAIITEISEASRVSGFGTVEISRSGATVIQYGKYRISITRPPFSDAIEVTIVQPIVKLSLSDYSISKKLTEKLSNGAEGIIISGPPGSGKSTFASSLANFYVLNEKIVKTFESPRDLQVPAEVTQYGPLEGSFDKAIDILLLVRPDYTIFDEVRRAPDFRVFSDMRLAGVGMVGVVHASSPLDAIQRFIGRVELGMIPHILDTIIFIKGGKIQKVYEIKLTVKVPSGMAEADLARPLVEVRDFESGEVEYEIYTYGEENVVVPVTESKSTFSDNPMFRLAESRIKDIIRRFDPEATVSIISNNRAQILVSKNVVPRIIGKGGSTVSELEKILGIKLDVDVRDTFTEQEIDFELDEIGSSITIYLPDSLIGKMVEIHIDNEYAFSSQVGKKARIKIDKGTDNGKRLINASREAQKIKIFRSK
ncbi:MAG: PINc/VapC family ATPase [Nitrososphaeraceae archaeon]